MRQTVVELVDDIDGSVARESVRFGLDGTEYEIDLSETNAAKFRETLAPFVQASRKLGKAAPQLDVRLRSTVQRDSLITTRSRAALPRLGRPERAKTWSPASSPSPVPDQSWQRNYSSAGPTRPRASEAAFASLAGTAPLEASSGQ